MSEHAMLSPSGAHRWLRCAGSVALERGTPNESSEYARWGTAAHELSALCLNTNTNAHGYLGRVIEVEGESIHVDPEMADCVQSYVQWIRTYANGHQLLVEQRIPIGHITGEEGAAGTADAVIITTDAELQVHDLKGGRGVAVSADTNEQLMIYALGAIAEYDLFGPFKRVRVVIHQPRVNSAPDEWDCSVEQLLEFGAKVKLRANRALSTLKVIGPNDLVPGEKQCKWCRAKASCPKLAADVLDTFERIHPESADPISLAHAMSKVGLVEDWCKAIRAKVEADLFAGVPVAGWKLVEGKRGIRQWRDETAAEELLRTMRLKVDEMYNKKLISPTQAEKLLKPTPRRWAKVIDQITQNDGKPSVAPESDKRPALSRADDFADVSEQEALV